MESTFENEEHSRTKRVFDNMAAQIDSGEVEAVFGSLHSRSSLEGLADIYKQEVSAMMPEAVKAAAEENIRKLREEEVLLGKGERDLESSGFGKRSGYGERIGRYSRSEEDNNLKLSNFLHGEIMPYLLGQNPSIKLLFNKNRVTVEFSSEADYSENRFAWQVNDEGSIDSSVRVSDEALPVSQEEYFHAVQEISLGTVEGLRFLDKRISDASTHVTHGSLLLDRVLSSAAAEMGAEEFGYWKQLSDEETGRFNQKYRDHPNWHKTPLGKEVNKRFQYPIVDHGELGGMLINFTNQYDDFIFNANGTINTDNEAILEVLGMNFGEMNQDLVYRMLDLLQTDGEAVERPEEIGKKLIEWGMRVLNHYRNTPEAANLTTHHQWIDYHLDEDKCRYKVSQEIIKKMNQNIKSGRDLTQINTNLQLLADKSRDVALQNAGRILSEVLPDENSMDVRSPSEEIMEEFGFTIDIFHQWVKAAKRQYEDQFQELDLLSEDMDQAIKDSLIDSTIDWRDD